MGDLGNGDPVKPKTRVILVGIGGATCSGKTTLAKHLARILPNSVIIHQDDFAPPQEQVPIHPVYKIQDWDAPAGAIQWPRMIESLREVKRTGVIPPEHISHDHLNEQKDVPLSDDIKLKWSRYFEEMQGNAERDGDKIVWGLVDGFLLYWHSDVYEQLDARVFLRIPEDVLKHRRYARHGYHTAVQFDPEGSLWRDPPHYWDQIVWPAYLEANREIFAGGDVEHGGPGGKVPRLVLVDAIKESMEELVDKCCELLKETLLEIRYT
ncbi:P-loop containing nucleoside triphosphate hydrolase protein [Lentinula guzmanii]|uniref:P-loop containing nucleoside triphosphate hydrolase protein n=2 Tax=Lentinula TaxID=5352 RepID=A0AA38JPM7_9AGAR|nr:P-loop containing nucleoside triphosphate hydrolase protein [Lentinula guzmanii]KAJ3988835.1 P-loop containing nucleoside triphosphate hydrolase protein [Lentinula detonsa]